MGVPISEWYLAAAIRFGGERTFTQDPKYAICLLTSRSRPCRQQLMTFSTAVQAHWDLSHLAISASSLLQYRPLVHSKEGRSREKTAGNSSKVLDGNRAATCFKLDRRIAMMLELQASSKMLLVQQQPCSSFVTSNC